MGHGVFERLKEVLLELEVRKLFFLKEANGKLAQGIQSKVRDIFVGVATNLVEVLPKNLPDVGPLETDTIHVVVGDVNQLLKAEKPGLPGLSRGLDLLPRHSTQCSYEVYDCRLKMIEKKNFNESANILLRDNG